MWIRPDAPGRDLKPQIVENYDGRDILLNKEMDLYLRVKDFPSYFVQRVTLITTDGTTLLGADDKAGVAEIMCAAEYIMSHPEISRTHQDRLYSRRGNGRGVDHFDVEKFGAKYAYTLDGGQIGELEYENFNAASAKIFIQGCNIHPGYAKNKMVNAMLVGMELNAMLPVQQRPEFTEHYEGFPYHRIQWDSGNCLPYNILSATTIWSSLTRKRPFMTSCVDFLNKKYGDIITLEMKDQYYNMREG